MSPSVSVIIPVYERAEQLKVAIKSVLDQTFENFELIIVDDGSGPTVRKAVLFFKDDRIKFLEHPTRQGAASARNTGINWAKSSFIAFLDSDDFWLPNKLETQLTFMCKNYGCRACVSGVFLIDKSRALEETKIPKNHSRICELLYVCDLSPGSTLMVDAGLFKEVGVFTASLERFEDWDWLLRCLEVTPILTVSEPLAKIHVGNWPQFKMVKNAAARLLELNSARIKRCGMRSYLCFRSSLYYETSIAAFMQRFFLLSGIFFILSISFYPFAPRGIWRRIFK